MALPTELQILVRENKALAWKDGMGERDVVQCIYCRLQFGKRGSSEPTRPVVEAALGTDGASAAVPGTAPPLPPLTGGCTERQLLYYITEHLDSKAHRHRRAHGGGIHMLLSKTLQQGQPSYAALKDASARSESAPKTLQQEVRDRQRYSLAHCIGLVRIDFSDSV